MSSHWATVLFVPHSFAISNCSRGSNRYEEVCWPAVCFWHTSPAIRPNNGYEQTDTKSALLESIVAEARKWNLPSKTLTADSSRRSVKNVEIHSSFYFWPFCQLAMDKLRRVLSGQEENEELGLTSQVANVIVWLLCYKLLMLTLFNVKKCHILVCFPVCDLRFC